VQVVFSGGEPFLRTDLDRIARAFHERSGARLFSLPTNGTLPERTLAQVDSMSGACPGATFNLIVSLDACGGVHDRLRGLPGGFEKALGLCRAALVLRERRPNVNLAVTTAVTEANLGSVLELRRFLRRELGPRGWHHNIQYDQRLGRSLEGVQALERELANDPGEGLFERLVSKWYVGFTNALILRQLREDRMLYRCVAGDRLAVVLPDGRMSPCEPFMFEQHYGWFEAPSLREAGLDPRRVMSDPRWKRARSFIEGGGCRACPWTCSATASLAYEPSNWKAFV
jgi:MoaA/NifB/PqqE/SkfB family radical SAM enzyme